MVSKMYLIRVLFFVGYVMFNVRGEHVPGCLGRGLGRGLGGYQPGGICASQGTFSSIQTSSALKPLGQSKQNFMCSILRKLEGMCI